MIIYMMIVNHQKLVTFEKDMSVIVRVKYDDVGDKLKLIHEKLDRTENESTFIDNEDDGTVIIEGSNIK